MRPRTWRSSASFASAPTPAAGAEENTPRASTRLTRKRIERDRKKWRGFASTRGGWATDPPQAARNPWVILPALFRRAAGLRLLTGIKSDAMSRFVEFTTNHPFLVAAAA